MPTIHWKSFRPQSIVGTLLKIAFIAISGALLVAAQTNNETNQLADTEMPAIRAKPKPGLIKVQNIINYGVSTSGRFGSEALVYDDLYAYLATPNGLYRTARPVTAQSSFQLIGFQNKTIFNLYVHNNKLYVLKESEPTLGNQSTDHTFLRSDDRGATFVPIDNGLQYCDNGYCSFLEARQAIFKDNLILLNVAGNYVISNNDGAGWITLLGSLEPLICGEAFELVNTRLFVGGECPLDVAYLRAITLRSDLFAVLPPDQQPVQPAVPNLENRNVMVIKHKLNSTDIYAGNEGGLLKSNNLGQSFRYVLRYRSGVYPYITNILFHSKNPNVILIGGFDKGASRKLFLAYSKDNGETWLDISNRTQSLVGEPSPMGSDETGFIAEESGGRVLVGVKSPFRTRMTVLRLRVDVAALR